MAQNSSPKNAVASLVVSRIVYAINWLNFGAMFALIGQTLKVGVVGLGVLTACLYLGLGLLQIPGGVLAAAFGPRRVVAFGILAYSAAALATALSTTLWEAAVLRFAVGAGMALVFAPAVVLVSKSLGQNRSGLGVGLFNSAYNLGGVLGLYAWIVVATAIGWQASIVLSGMLGVVTGLLVLRFVPADTQESKFRVKRPELLAILLDRRLILLGLGTLGIGAGNSLISGFMVYYLNKSLGVGLTTAGLVAACVVIAPIVTALWGGRLYDRSLNPRPLAVTSIVVLSLGLLLAGVRSVLTAIVSSTLVGIGAGVGFTIAFAWAKDLNSVAREYDSLAIAWVNGISLTGAFLPPIVFSTVVQTWGYAYAWGVACLFCLLLATPLLLLEGGHRARAA